MYVYEATHYIPLRSGCQLFFSSLKVRIRSAEAVADSQSTLKSLLAMRLQGYKVRI